jgi:hypothetical protein
MITITKTITSSRRYHEVNGSNKTVSMCQQALYSGSRFAGTEFRARADICGERCGHGVRHAQRYHLLVRHEAQENIQTGPGNRTEGGKMSPISRDFISVEWYLIFLEFI